MWSNDRALLVEVADVADVQVRKSDIRVVADVDDVTTAPVLRGSVYCTIVLTAFLVESLELYDRCFDSVCVDMLGVAQRVHIPPLRTVQHAALAHLAATAPSKLDSREGCLHWWCVLTENFKPNSDSMAEDMQVLMRKDLQQLSCFGSCCGWSFFASRLLFPRIF